MISIDLTTDDGVCPAVAFQPPRPGHGVLLYMDGIGMRPTIHALGERLAASGYYVLVPDLFYRIGPYTAPDPKALFSDPNVRAEWFKNVMTKVTPAGVMRDTRSFITHLANAAPGKLGATGYCMGGRMALLAAGTYPDAFAAVASYHGGNLANDALDSPHLLASKITASVYVAAAIEDATFPDDQKQRLEAALTDANVDHVIETYPARHGWAMSDTPVYDPAQSERHWETLLALFAKHLT